MSRKPSPTQVREINDSIRYAMWSVFATVEPLGDDTDRKRMASEVHDLVADLATTDTVVRGIYDVAGLRADADFMIWWHAETIEQLQSAYHRFLRTELGAALEPVWSVAALHRPAEFNKSHVPAFLA
ncbi:MAG: chlorite dismutase family protein, partial [Lapillicoccus sp.]